MKSLTLLFTLLIGVAAAQQPQTDPALQKMRESLKNTMLQLRTEQTEKAALQAEKAELEAKVKELTATVASQGQALEDNKKKADKSIADLTAKSDTQQKQIAQINEALAKWQAGYKKAEAVAQDLESKRSRLADEVIKLDRKVQDRETKNIELYKLGKEILTRYENFGLGSALLAREPFTGIAKVKFETFVQDYSDKLTDQKIKPEPAAKAATGDKPASTPTPKS